MADKVDNRAFAEMEYATADKTAVNLLGDKSRVTKENVHDMLMAAGFTPGLGNIADAADALLYAVEGEFGSAALSTAAMIPFIGQAVSAKKALKIAKESGEKMVTMYRGIPEWFPGEMVKEGKWVGGREFLNTAKKIKPLSKDAPTGWGSLITHGTAGIRQPEKLDMIEGVLESLGKNSLWVTESKEYARRFGSIVLEFEVPKSYLNKNFLQTGKFSGSKIGVVNKGLHKEFLKKVHK